MSMTITLGWWIIPAIISIAAIWWMMSQNYSGDYNFTAVITVPTTAFVICFVWLIYTAIGWGLAV